MLEKEGTQEKIMENVTLLEVEPEGIRISTLFEEPKLIVDAKLTKIDFLGGAVTLRTAK